MEKKKERLDKIRLDGLKFLRKNEVAILNLPVGFGKTRLVLDYLSERFDKLTGQHELSVTVFCPKSIIMQWVKEIRVKFPVKWQEFDFGVYREMVMKVEDGKNKRRWMRILILSNSLASVQSAAMCLDNNDIWVFDEPKHLKSPTQARQYLIDYCIPPARTILLDATVLENNYEEIDYLSDFLVLGGRDKLASATFSPPVPKLRKIEKKIIRVIPQDKKVRIKIRGWEKHLLHTLKSGNPKQRIYGALRQSLNFLSSLEEKGDPGYEKLSVLIEFLMKGDSLRRGIIFTRSLTSIKIISEALTRFRPTAGIIGSMSAKQRQKVKEDFNSGKIDWIVATKAGERGMDLFSGNTVVHFDLPYSQSSYRQRDRVTRRSSDLSDTTTIYTFLIKDSIEELQFRHIKCKMKMAAEARDGTFDFVPRESWTKFLEEKYEK